MVWNASCNGSTVSSYNGHTMNAIWTMIIRFMRRSGWYVLGDAMIVVIAYRVALTGRFGGAAPSTHYLEALSTFTTAIVIVHLVSNHWSGMYSRLWRFASSPDALIVVQAWFGAAIPLMLLDLLPAVRLEPTIRPFPLSALALGSFLSAAGFTLLRFRTRLLSSTLFRMRRAREQSVAGRGPIRALIVGAGEAGQSLSWQLQNRRGGRGYQVLGFIDDDVDKQGFNVHGIPIIGNRDQLPELVVIHRVELIVLAIHAISGEAFRDILSICQRTPARIQIVPDVFESLAEKPNVPLVRDVTVHDLLGRAPTEIDIEACSGMLTGRTVVVTGGAGSIGSELCRQVMNFNPDKVLAVDINETGLYELESEVRMQLGVDNLAVRVADVTSAKEMTDIFGRYRPAVVFHTAAYKHVPLMELHPRTVLRTNVIGTLNVGRAAGIAGVERLVLISTDKAVEPVSVYGVTKLLAEHVIARLASESHSTLYTSVRFGNVLGSRGSVVPLFEKQILAGGPVTVTHRDITRFYMTIPEAVRLVIQAAVFTQGGDLFMLEMGESISINELAERMIRLRGLRPGVDIPIEFSGLRPGEKLHEELIEAEERRENTEHAQICRVLAGSRLASGSDLQTLEDWIRATLLIPEDRLKEALHSYASEGLDQLVGVGD